MILAWASPFKQHLCVETAAVTLGLCIHLPTYYSHKVS